MIVSDQQYSGGSVVQKIWCIFRGGASDRGCG
jgi:hypothetical protein